MHYLRLRPGVRLPSFQAGEHYILLGETQPTGYVYVELAGKRRCVNADHFEEVDGPDPASVPDEPLTDGLTGLSAPAERAREDPGGY